MDCQSALDVKNTIHQGNAKVDFSLRIYSGRSLVRFHRIPYQRRLTNFLFFNASTRVAEGAVYCIWIIFGKALAVLFEIGLSEDKKRTFLKELEQVC